MFNSHRDNKVGGSGGKSGGFGGRSRSGGGNYNKKYSDRDSEKRSFGGWDSKKLTMHQATCDDCGQKCEVPFKPTSGKPIFCKECFSKHNGSDDRRSEGVGRSGGRDDRRNDRGERGGQSDEKLDLIIDKLDQLLRLLSSSEPM